MTPEFKTVQALRSDVALQIARHAKRLGVNQLAAAKALGVPQPTLSKIVNGNTSELSLELLLRIAVRAGLRVTLQTGQAPEEAGAFVASGRAHSNRVFPSSVATQTHAATKQWLREQTPAQRLEAFLEHNVLANELREIGRAFRRRSSPQGSTAR